LVIDTNKIIAILCLNEVLSLHLCSYLFLGLAGSSAHFSALDPAKSPIICEGNLYKRANKTHFLIEEFLNKRKKKFRALLFFSDNKMK
jgi:hypothetical protein